jgi:glutamyl-tRNA reductase
VPRDLDPAINQLDGCYLYDIDDLERVVEATVAGRREEAERAEAIVAEEARVSAAWQRSLDVVPAIASLRRRAQEIRAAELARASGKLAGLSPRERDAVESLTTQIVNKLLHVPTVRLKEAAAGTHGSAYADTVRHLFDLGDDG